MGGGRRERGKQTPFCLEGIRTAQRIRKASQRDTFEMGLDNGKNFSRWRIECE